MVSPAKKPIRAPDGSAPTIPADTATSSSTSAVTPSNRSTESPCSSTAAVISTNATRTTAFICPVPRAQAHDVRSRVRALPLEHAHVAEVVDIGQQVDAQGLLQVVGSLDTSTPCPPAEPVGNRLPGSPRVMRMSPA